MSWLIKRGRQFLLSLFESSNECDRGRRLCDGGEQSKRATQGMRVILEKSGVQRERQRDIDLLSFWEYFTKCTYHLRIHATKGKSTVRVTLVFFIKYIQALTFWQMCTV